MPPSRPHPARNRTGYSRTASQALALVAWVAQCAYPQIGAADQVDLGGRFYRIDLPDNPTKAPILLALHGGAGNPNQFARSSGLSPKATDLGYAVIYPAGSGRGPLLTWNGGYCCAYAALQNVDDIAFLDSVIDDAVSRYGLEGEKVFITGMSNGAIMAQSFAAVRPNRVRAVGSVSGTLDLTDFAPQGPVPLLHIHGTLDTQVPYDGGRGSTGHTDTDFTAVPRVIDAFVAQFPPGLATDSLTIDPADDGMSVLQATWAQGGKPLVRLLTVTGGGHVWPGGARAARQKAATKDIDATTEILRFFAAHL